jgi:peptidoglycan/xylan/chitin deacetylase (PgdA/CDA1 family)
MHRRGFLKGFGVAGGSAVVAAAAAWRAEGLTHSIGPPRPDLNSTISPAAVRGHAQVWWSADTTERTVALTFDDGPTEQFTGSVLDLLARHRVTATFFLIGALVEVYPDLVRRTRDAGHQLDNHSYDHVSAAASSGEAVYTSMQRGADAIEKVAGRRPRWYRPPRGEITSATMLAALRADQDLAMWSVVRDQGDLHDDDVSGVARHLMTALHPGAVIDLHDGIGQSAFTGLPDRSLLVRRQTELRALAQALPVWLDAGYRFTTLSQLIPASS